MYDIDLGYDYGASAISNYFTFFIIAVVVALCGAILIFALFLTKKNEKKFTGFIKWLYEFLSFNKLTIETVLKFTYVFAALYLTIASFSLISTSFWLFLVVLVLGNVGLRVIYEMLLLFILMYHNIVEINKKTK